MGEAVFVVRSRTRLSTGSKAGGRVQLPVVSIKPKDGEEVRIQYAIYPR